jgi:hypothetical protein
MMRGGLVLALSAVLATAGCGGDEKSGDSAGGDTKASDATAALVDATAKLQEQSFKAVIDMGDAGSLAGVMDPKKKVSEFAMENNADGETMKTELRKIDGTTYVRLTIPGADIPGMDGKSWRKMDGRGGPGTLGDFDAAQIAKSLETAADVKWAGDDAVTGTIDLAKTGKQLGLAETDLSKLTEKTVPFQATFDGEGRLVRYSLTMPKAAGAEFPTKMDVTYSDFGLPVDVKAPAESELAKG